MLTSVAESSSWSSCGAALPRLGMLTEVAAFSLWSASRAAFPLAFSLASGSSGGAGGGAASAGTSVTATGATADSAILPSTCSLIFTLAALVLAFLVGLGIRRSEERRLGK